MDLTGFLILAPPVVRQVDSHSCKIKRRDMFLLKCLYSLYWKIVPFLKTRLMGLHQVVVARGFRSFVGTVEKEAVLH